jgi:NhaP-type Na+/H+ or K+/H+ antiporter
MHEHAIFHISSIILIGFFCQWVAWRVKLPAILFLLMAGIIAGPVTGMLQPEELFGDLLFPMISLAVAIILFEGSLTLRFEEIQGVEGVVRRLVSTGVLVTWCVVTLATHWILAFPWPLAILFGAITVVTGPTVIVPMLRTVRPNARLSNILRWEGIIIDPVGALLAVLVFEFMVAGGFQPAMEHTLSAFTRTLLVGGALGVAVGALLGHILRRHWLPEYLHNLAALSFVVSLFALSNGIQEESGLLAVTVMGMWLANMKGVSVEDIIDFKENLSVVLISALFIILAARIDFAQFEILGWGALGVFLAMQFIARPLKVALATWGSTLSWRERALLAWIAPRGIVAAAIAALFAIKLQAQGFAEAPLLVPLTFLVIIGTVVLQSATAGPLAKYLGVAEPEPKGFLIIGANPLARAVASALDKHGFQTLLTDADWSHARVAMMSGLRTFYGNAVSDHADRRLDLVGMGQLLALSPEHHVNALAAMRYEREFGKQGVYLLGADAESGEESAASIPGQTLFGNDADYKKLLSMLAEGAKIHSTKLSDAFDADAYYKQYYGRSVLLFAIDPKGKLHVFTKEKKLAPDTGWTLLGLNSPEEASSQAANKGRATEQTSKDLKDMDK